MKEQQPAIADRLVPDTEVAIEFGVTATTLWRWDHEEQMDALGWPPPVRMKRIKHRFRSGLDIFKGNLLKRAIRERARLLRIEKEKQQAAGGAHE
jgi:hypothetical protein